MENKNYNWYSEANFKRQSDRYCCPFYERSGPIRVVAKSLGFSPSTLIRVMKKHCSNLDLLKRGAMKILTTT